MASSRGKGLLARRRFGRYVRRAGWFVFWGAAAWTLVANMIANKLVIAPLVIGLSVLAVTEAAAWLLKRYRDRLRSAGELPERSLQRSRSPSRSARTGDSASMTGTEPAAAASGYETPSRSFGLLRPRAAASPAAKAAGFPRFKRVLVYTAIALPVLAIGLAWLCFDDQPLVAERAKVVDASEYEPQQQPTGSRDPDTPGEAGKIIIASQADVADFVSQRFRNAAVRVALRPSIAVVEASVPVRWNPFGKWINIEAVLHEIGGTPTVEKLKIGSLSVPAVAADYAMGLFLERFNGTEHSIRSVTLLESKVRVVYE